jgi:pyocin large subunit-like protein
VATATWGQGGGGPANPQDLNRYSYTSNNPLKYTDSTGHFLDTLLDIGFIAYDVYDIPTNGWSTERGLALGADVLGAVVPFASGGGMAVRAAAHADDVIDAARGVDAGSEGSQTVYRALREGEDPAIGLVYPTGIMVKFLIRVTTSTSKPTKFWEIYWSICHEYTTTATHCKH